MIRTKKQRSRGFSHHFLLPVLAVIAVGILGVYTLSFSDAATTGCTDKILQKGSKNSCVKYAERMLNATSSTGSDVHVDSKYTSSTVKKTKRFQKKQNIEVNGIVGTETWVKLCEQSYSGSAAKAKTKVCTTTTSTANVTTNEDATTTAVAVVPTASSTTSGVTFNKLANFRDAAASSNSMKTGVLFRSARLYEASSSDITTLSNFMSGGLIIDLREAKTQKSYPDKAVPGVSHASYPMTSTTNYTKFVTGSSDRAAINSAITAIATSPGKVLVHCTKGRDRTGWVVAMVMYSLGANDSQVMNEYLKTSSTSKSTLNKGLDKARSQYGSIDNYIKTGLGVSDATLASLRAKLKP